MTLVQLEYLVALHNCKNFVNAAEQCFVTQPAMTIQIKNLEEELGVTIFDRSKKPLEATEIGKVLVEQAVFVLQEAQKLKELVKHYKSEMDGELNVGVIPTLAPYLLPLFIKNFEAKYPQVIINFFEDVTENLIQKMKNGLLDAVIATTEVEVEGVHIIPIFYERIFAYVSPGHPLYKKAHLNREDLNVRNIWLLNEGNCFRNQVISICDVDFKQENKVHFRYEGSSLESLKRIVEIQKGATLLPELSLMDLSGLDKEMVKEIKDQQPVREISIMVNKSFLKKQLINKMKEEILLAIPDTMKKAGPLPSKNGQEKWLMENK